MDRSRVGGTAIRLTAHPGVEVFGKFSPDGKWIAFTGQYDGDEQVYVVPATGGEPKQLTSIRRAVRLRRAGATTIRFMAGPTTARRIFFRSLRDSWALPIARLYTVSATGGPAEPLPMPKPARATFHRTARRSSIRLNRATSDPRSATAAARPISSTSSI